MDGISAGSQEPKSSYGINHGIAALVAVLFALATPQGWAAEIVSGEAEARRVVKTLGDSILTALKVNDLDARRRMLIASAVPAVDFRTLGAGVLAHAQVQVPAGQQADIMEGLTAYIARAIIDEIEQVHPREARLGASTVKSANEVRVAMALAGPNRSIDADWVVKHSAAGWRVTDIFVSGYSMAGHYGGILGRRVAGSVEQLADMMSAEKRRIPRFTELARVEKAIDQRPAHARVDATYARPAAQPVTHAAAPGNQQRLAPPAPRVDLAQAQPQAYRMMQTNDWRPAPPVAPPTKRPIDEWKLDQLNDLLRF